VRYFICFEQFAEVVEDILCSFEREARDDDIAAGSFRGVYYIGDLFFYVAFILVDPVAVGGLDEDIVGLVEDGRVVDDGPVGSADVAGEEDGSLFAVSGDFQFYYR